MDNWETKYLEEVRMHSKKALQYFSNIQKSQREIDVCRAFLRCAGIKYSNHEIVVSNEEPVDINFRAAQFQIREVMEDNRRRGDELREILKAKLVESLMKKYNSPNPISLSELVEIIARSLISKANRYGTDQCGNLDALIYVNLRYRFLEITSAFPDLSVLKIQNWRSVSLLFPPYSIVLYVNPNAPDFLKAMGGIVLHNWKEPDGLFDE